MKKDDKLPHAAVVMAKTALEKGHSVGEEVGVKAEVIGTQIFQLYANLLLDEALGQDCQGTDGNCPSR